MTTTAPLKALATYAETMDVWTRMVEAGELPDRGLVHDEKLTAQQTDGTVVYLFPADAVDDVLTDLDKVLNRLGRPAPKPIG